MRDEDASGFGEADAAAEAVEELGAQVFLELQDLLGERGLRDVAALGGAGEVTGVGDGADVTELVDFHYCGTFVVSIFGAESRPKVVSTHRC